MAEDSSAFEDNPPAPSRLEPKRKYDDMSDHERRTGFSSSPAERERRTGFSGPPGEVPERKFGFLGAPPGFSAAPNDYERKTGFSGESDRRTGFSGESERRTGFSGPASGDRERRSGFSGPPSGPAERKTGFSGPPGGGGGGEFERKFPPAEVERKTGFSGPPSGEQDRKTGFSGPPESSNYSAPPALSQIEIAKQKAEEIVARLVAQDSKRPRTDGSGDEPPSTMNAPIHEQHSYPREGHDMGHTYQERSHDQAGNFFNMQGNPQSHRMEIPNARVGLIIGKSGETIKLLQNQSGARIQVTRDADHDPRNPNRQVEIMGTPDQIKHAEQMIKDAIAEAEAGGSGGVVASGFGGPSAFGEQMEIRVPNNKVGLIIGRGGDTIKNLQSRTGARIQLVPLQHTADMGQDSGLERIITLLGSRQQIEMASDMIKEVISENRLRGPPGGYNQQQGFRPPGPPQWGPPRGPMQPQSYDYQQQGSYGAPSQQYASRPQSFGGYGQQPASTQDFSAPPQSYGGYSQPSPVSNQQPQQSASYSNYYSQPTAGPTNGTTGYMQSQGSFSPQEPYVQQQVPGPQSNTQSTPPQQSYGPAYGQPAPSQQSYGQAAASAGYGQPNYGSQGITQPGYGASAGPQQGLAQPGYLPQGAVYGQQAAGQPTFSQQDATQQVAYGHQAPVQVGYGQTDTSQAGYGQGGSAFRPQAPVQQQPVAYAQQEAGPHSYGPAASGQPSYGQVQSYGQQESLLPAYGQASAPTNYATHGQQHGPGASYTAQGSAQPVYAQQGPVATQHGAQDSSGQPVAVQPAGYGQQGSVNSYAYQGVQSGYASYTDGYSFDQQGSQQVYTQPAHFTSSSDATATVGNGGTSNASAGLSQSAAQS